MNRIHFCSKRKLISKFERDTLHEKRIMPLLKGILDLSEISKNKGGRAKQAALL